MDPSWAMGFTPQILRRKNPWFDNEETRCSLPNTWNPACIFASIVPHRLALSGFFFEFRPGSTTGWIKHHKNLGYQLGWNANYIWNLCQLGVWVGTNRQGNGPTCPVDLTVICGQISLVTWLMFNALSCDCHVPVPMHIRLMSTTVGRISCTTWDV